MGRGLNLHLSDGFVSVRFALWHDAARGACFRTGGEVQRSLEVRVRPMRGYIVRLNTTWIPLKVNGNLYR